jgi:sucrose-6-phosphate hydrolase SacC (GH32 family)
MHLFFDVASCELFADGGETVLTDIYFPTKNFGRIRFESLNGAVNIKSAMLYELKSAR